MKILTSKIVSSAIGALALLGAMNALATTYTAIATGNWNANATWSPNTGFPVAGDTAIINGAFTVTVPDAEACTTLTLQTSASAALTIGSAGALTVSGVATVTTGNVNNNGTLTVNGNLTGAGALTQGANSLLTLGGTFTVTTVTATAAGNTVNYAGAGQTVKVTSYANLTLSGSGSSTFGAVSTISGNLNATGSATYSTSSGTATVGGNMTVGGTAVFSKSGGNNFSWAVAGNLAVNGGTLNVSGIATGLSVGGTTTLSSGSIVFNNLAVGPLVGDFSMSGGTFNPGSAPIEFRGNFSDTGGTLTTGSGVLLFSGAGKSITANAPISMAKANITGTITIPNGTAVTFPGASGTGLTVTSPGVLDNLGTVAASYGSAAALAGSGQFINDVNATLNLASGSPTTITTLTTSAANNTVNYTTSGKTALALTYVNLGLVGGGNMSASDSTVTGNLTVSDTTAVGNTAWPVSPVGTVIYSSSGSSTLPGALSISGFTQSAGTVKMPASGTLTVTGAGAGAFTRTAGTFTTAAGSTVLFTGAVPGIGGTAGNSFVNLTIEDNATNTAPLVVTNTLTIDSGDSLDVTALTNYTLSATELVVNSGVILGNVATTAGSTAQLSAETSGFGTNTITGSLALDGANVVNLDLNSTAAAGSDLLAVGGTLTLNNTLFNLKAPSPGAAIDTANDYLLVTAAAISGTPVLSWAAGFVPASTNNYSLVVNGSQILLHYSSVITVGTPVLTAVNNGGVLTLSWDSTDFPGYSVQSLTNSSGLAGTGWTDTGSGTTSPYPVTIDPTQSPVFFRLAHP